VSCIDQRHRTGRRSEGEKERVREGQRGAEWAMVVDTSYSAAVTTYYGKCASSS
jgi:hypothetical protein